MQVSADHGRQLTQQHRIQRTPDRPLMQLTLTGLAEAIGREHPRHGMQQDLFQTEGFGQATGKLPRCAAVGNQDASTDVMPPEQGNLPDRSRHRLDSEVKGALRQLLLLLTQLLGKQLKALLCGPQIRWLIAIGPEHSWKSLHLQSPQQQVGIRDGQRSATSVTGWAGISPSRAWTHSEATAIGSDDRSTSRCDGMDRQTGCSELQACDLRLGTAFPVTVRRSGRQAEHVGACAAHVHTHQGRGAKAALLRGCHGPHHAAGGTGKNCVFGKQGAGVLQGPTGGHHPESGLIAQSVAHLSQIGVEHRLQGSLHHGGLPPRHQTRQRTDLVRTDHSAESGGPDRLRQHLFVDGVTPGMHQRNGTTADAGPVMTGKPLPELISEPQSLQLPAVSIKPAEDLLNGRDQ